MDPKLAPYMEHARRMAVNEQDVVVMLSLVAASIIAVCMWSLFRSRASQSKILGCGKLEHMPPNQSVPAGTSAFKKGHFPIVRLTCITLSVLFLAHEYSTWDARFHPEHGALILRNATVLKQLHDYTRDTLPILAM
jgi:hypothetical protein